MKIYLPSLIFACGLLPLANGTDIATLESELKDLRARVEEIEKHIRGEHPEQSIHTESALLTKLAEIGKTKFETFCTACHKHDYTDPMLAPPIIMAQDHYRQMYGSDKEAFVNAVVEWVKAPSQDKTLMPGAIRNFNIMPPFPLPDDDLKSIATYLFEAKLEEPKGFEQHVQQERSQLGGQGHGPGFGSGRSGQGFGSGGQGQGFGSGTHGPGNDPYTTASSIEDVTSVSELVNQGRAKFELFCMVCHKYDQEEPMLAPPIFAVADHYKQTHGDDRQAFIDAIVQWTKNPSEEKTLMPGAVTRFKLMPPFPIPDPDAKAVATFMFETDFTIPDWYEEHYLEEHGEAR